MSEDGDRPSASLAQRVARARQDAGLSKLGLAERIGVRLSVIDRYEAGSTIPSAHLEAIAEVTSHSLEWLRGEVPAEAAVRTRPREESPPAAGTPAAETPAQEPPPARLRIAPAPNAPTTETTRHEEPLDPAASPPTLAQVPPLGRPRRIHGGQCV